MSYDNLYIPNGIQLVNGLPVYVSENKYWSAYPLPYGNIGQLTDAYFSDNTGDGDGGLRNLEENISIANKLDYLQYQNSLYYNFNIDTTFLNGSSGATNPFGSGSSTTIEPIVIGGTGSIGGSESVGGTESVSGIVGTGGTGGVGGAGSIGGTSSEDDLTMPDADNYSAQFTARLSLIEKYCKKWGKTVDVDKIKKEYADDPQAGVEYCDDILNNKFNQKKLSDIVEADYRKYIDAHIEKGKKVSDSWVETALKNGTSTPNFSTSGVDKNTILDVIGTFMTNKDVKNGKVSLENIFEVPDVASSLVESMKQKADDFLLDEDTDEDKKEALVGFIEDMRNTYDDFTKEPSIEKRTKIIKAFTEAFEIMRTEQARRNDEAAPQHYGLPEDSEIKFDNFSKRADEEIEAHKNRRKLRRNI